MSGNPEGKGKRDFRFRGKVWVINNLVGTGHEVQEFNYPLVGFFLYFSQYSQKLLYTSSSTAMIFSFSALLRFGVIFSLSLPGFKMLRILR